MKKFKDQLDDILKEKKAQREKEKEEKEKVLLDRPLITNWAKRWLASEGTEQGLFDVRTLATDEAIISEIKKYSDETGIDYEKLKSEVIQEKKRLQVQPAVIKEDIATIPKALQKPEFRFILLGHWMMFRNKKGEIRKIPGQKTKTQLEELKADGWVALGKAPSEPEWQKTRNYPFNHPRLLAHQQTGDNYGIITGVGDLGILDDDTPDQQLIKVFEKEIGQTFSVLTGSGGVHLYVKIPGLDKKIIFFNHDGAHCGEIQWEGQQCVAAGSMHPLGRKYEVLKDIPILEISAEKFKEVFKDYIPKKEKIVRERLPTVEFNGDRVQDIPITNIITTTGLMDMGDGCYQGVHPRHGSSGGMNFRINTHDNTWYCFRCRGGGGPAELIGVMEGIIPCSSAGGSCFTKDQAQEVIRIARSKYNLKAPAGSLETMEQILNSWSDEKEMVDRIFKLETFTLDFFKELFKIAHEKALDILSLLEKDKVVEFESEKNSYIIPKGALLMKEQRITEAVKNLRALNKEYRQKEKEERNKKREEEREREKSQKNQKENNTEGVVDTAIEQIEIKKKGPMIEDWPDLLDIEKYVIYPGEDDEFIYEIHVQGKVIKMVGKEIYDYNLFMIRLYSQIGVMLVPAKKMRVVWANLLNAWYTMREEITPDKQSYVSIASIAEEEIKNYIDGCKVCEDYIYKENIVTYKNDCLYVPYAHLEKILKRKEIKLTNQDRRYALKNLMADEPISLKVEKKSVRFYRFKPSKFDIDLNNRFQLKKDEDIIPEPPIQQPIVVSTVVQKQVEEGEHIEDESLVH